VRQRVDNRTRRDRVLRRNIAFTEQIPAMSDAYLVWSLQKTRMGFRGFYDQYRSEYTNEMLDSDGGEWPMTVVDAFCELLLKLW
jgi:hypothetical protein